MKPTPKPRPITLLMRAKTPADKRRIADVEKTLSRQVGFPVRLDLVVVDTSNDEWRTTSWKMKRQDQAAVAMLLRRGKTPNSPPLMTDVDIIEKSHANAIKDKSLTKKG